MKKNNHENILVEILNELERAKNIHPNFPKDLIHQAGIVAEESGEVMKAAIDYIYHKGNIQDVRKELIQTAAMCLRVLYNLPSTDKLEEKAPSSVGIMQPIIYNK